MASTENKLSGAKNNAAYSKRRSGGYRRSYRRSGSFFCASFVKVVVLCVIIFNFFGGFVLVPFRSTVSFSDPSVSNNLTYTDNGITHYTYIGADGSHRTLISGIEDLFDVIQPLANFCNTTIKGFFILSSFDYSYYDPVNNCSYGVLTYRSFGKYYTCLFRADGRHKNCNRLPDSWDDGVVINEVYECETNTDFGSALKIWDRTDNFAFRSSDGWCSFDKGNSEWVTIYFFGNFDVAKAAYYAALMGGQVEDQ